MPHPELLKVLQKLIESVESLNEVMAKRVRKLKGSDLELELVRIDDMFTEVYT